jgi:hypothetical protein
MNDVQGLLYQIREVSTDHLERGDLESVEVNGERRLKLVVDLEKITTLSEAAIAALIKESG